MSVNGAEVKYALQKATTWGTAVACGAADGFLALPWSADPDNQLIVDDSLGAFFAVDASPGQTRIEPTVTAYARYNDEVLLSMLAAVFGTAGAPTTHAAGTTSKDHTLKIAQNTDGLFFTLCGLMGSLGVEEIPSWKVAKVVVTGETGKPVTFAFSGPGFDLVADSAINTTSTFNNVTILERANRMYYSQCEIRMNDASGGALSGSDKVGASKFVLTLERKLTGVYGAFVSGGRDCIDEATNDGPFSGSLDLTFPRLSDFAGRAEVKANTSRKCEIILTGPIIEGAIPYLMKFQLTNLKPSKNANPHKPGIIDNTRTYQVLGASAAPTGMTGNTDPCWCMLTNKITTDLLVA